MIACVDGLTGFTDAIGAVYPQTEIQQCIIHQIRNCTKFVRYKDIKALMADLKQVYGAPDEQSALFQLETFDEKWGKKYPKIVVSWRKNWVHLSTYFKYPQEVRTLIHTTNAIEGFNRSAAENDEKQGCVSDRRQPIQNAVSGDDGHHKKIDRTAEGLGTNPFAAGDFL